MSLNKRIVTTEIYGRNVARPLKTLIPLIQSEFKWAIAPVRTLSQCRSNAYRGQGSGCLWWMGSLVKKNFDLKD